MKKLFGFFFLILLNNCFTEEKISPIGKNFTEIQDENTLSILNSDFSLRKTAKIKLKNGLEAYIISDPKALQSSCALVVEVGSWNDPKKYPGTAHFLEHMLFKGSKAYPEEGNFQQYVKDHGGVTNAFTACSCTQYIFSISHESFESSLDRFAHFFIDPLFNFAESKKELKAVNDEFERNREDDNWRLYMIQKELCQNDHPHHAFSTGNSQTLSIIPENLLKVWFEENYSPQIMHMVVYSSLPLEQLKDTTSKIFGQIPTRPLPQKICNKCISSDVQKSHIVTIKPIQHKQNLFLIWEIPSNLIEDSSHSLELISYAIQRGHKNSLLEEMKKQGLAFDLNIDLERISPYHQFLTLQIELQDDGVQKKEEVLSCVFSYLQSIQETGIPQYIYDEMVSMKKINYQYQQRQEGFKYVSDLAQNMLYETLSTFPSQTILPSSYDQNKTKEFLSLLKPLDCQMYLFCDPQEFNLTLKQQEKWYKTEYDIQNLSLDKIFTTSSHASLPQTNPFIPTDLKLIPSLPERPILTNPLKLNDDPKGKLYFAQDNLYETPHAALFWKIQDPLIDGSASNSALLDLHLALFQHELEDMLLAAQVAGLNATINPVFLGLEIKITGYSEKASYFTENLFLQLKNFTVSEKRFNHFKTRLLRQYDDAAKQLPLMQTSELLKSLIVFPSSSSKDKQEALKHITYQDYQKFHDNFLTNTYTEALFTGNLTQQSAEKLWQEYHTILKGNPFNVKDHPLKRILNLSCPCKIQNSTPMQGTGIILTLHEGHFSFKNKACQQILSTALSDAFFTSLRSKQKTGYQVVSFDQEIEKELFQFFAVQSSGHATSDLLFRFELFLEDYLDNLTNYITEERFESIKKTFVQQLEKRLDNLEQMTERLMLLSYYYNADYSFIDKRIEAFKNLTYKEFYEFASFCLSDRNVYRLAISTEGKLNQEKEIYYQNITPMLITKMGSYFSCEK
jgi:insulysin